MGTEPLDGQRADLLAHGEADVAQASVRWPDLDVNWEATVAGGEGHRNDKAPSTLVEQVRGDDEDGSFAGLLAPWGGLEIGEPHLTAANGPHRSSSPSARVTSHTARSASSSSQAAGSAWSLA
jgi:hypothetical protein